MKHIKITSQSIFLFALLLFTILLVLSSCTSEKCKFDKADNKYLLGQYDSLSYLENGTDTLKLKVTTEVSTSYVKQGWVTANEFEDGSSEIFVPSKYLTLSLSVSSCSEYMSVSVMERIWRKHFNLKKDTVSNKVVQINNYLFKNCFVFIDSMKVQEVIYTREHGIIKLALKDGYLLELIHETE